MQLTHHDRRLQGASMTKIKMRLIVTSGIAAAISILLAACANTEVVSPHVQSQVPTVIDKWSPLAKDGLHDMEGLRDPAKPTAQLLQEPRDGLAGLPANPVGNMVNWVKALVIGAISPRRTRVAPTTGVEPEELVMDMDIMLNLNGSMPKVRFPHRAHTMWLACAKCHPAIFVPQKGANAIRMEKILMGEQCGICHGAVAFPPTDCTRCHNVPHLDPLFIRPSADTGGRP